MPKNRCSCCYNYIPLPNPQTFNNNGMTGDVHVTFCSHSITSTNSKHQCATFISSYHLYSNSTSFITYILLQQ